MSSIEVNDLLKLLEWVRSPTAKNLRRAEELLVTLVGDDAPPLKEINIKGVIMTPDELALTCVREEQVCEIVIDSVCCTIGKVDPSMKMTDKSVKIVQLSADDSEAQNSRLKKW